MNKGGVQTDCTPPELRLNEGDRATIQVEVIVIIVLVRTKMNEQHRRHRDETHVQNGGNTGFNEERIIVVLETLENDHVELIEASTDFARVID